MNKNNASLNGIIESGEYFLQLAENINEVFWLVSPDWDEVLYVSPAFEKIWGQKAEDLYQDPHIWTEMIHPDDRVQVIDDIPKDLNNIGESIDFREYRIKRPDGQILWIKARAYPIYDDNGQVFRIAGVAEDITERKHGELMMQNVAIAVSAQLGEAFFESLTLHLAKIFDLEYVFIALLDEYKEDSVNTIALCVDGEIVDNLSYDLAGTPCSHVVRDSSDKPRSYSCDIQQLFPDDHMLVDMDAESYVGVPLIDASGKNIGLVVVLSIKQIENIKQVENILQIFAVRTVAEMQRLKTEETLAKSSKEWSFAMDFFEDAIYLIDLDDKLLRANRSFYLMTGLTPALAVGRDITSIIHPEGEEIPCPVCKARKERRDEVIIMEKDHPDNSSGKPIQITVQIIRDNDSSPLSVLMGIRDLSNIRLKEKERAKLQHQLHQSQKMDALGKLTGGIAHDYNNMLGIILGYSDLLEDVLNDQPKLAKYVHEIHHAAERGAKLTKKLLAYSRQSTSEAERINLNSLLLNQQHMLEKTLTVRIKLVFDLAEDLWAVWIDASEMEDTIFNISINAMHAIETNGQLTIRSSNEQLNQLEAEALGLTSGDYVLLSITDTGCGMDEAIRDKIFEPFFSTKGEQGTGLGLSRVYGFVRSSGSAIKAYSEPGQGSQFALYFPRYHGNDQDEQLVEENKEVDIRGTETILIVDDEPALLRLSSEILKRHGFNVLSVESAKKALQILEHETVDLVFSDVIMPEMDGYQLAALVKEKYPAIKIQLASGFTDNRNMGMVDESLQQNLLFKPFNSQSLLQRIRERLNE